MLALVCDFLMVLLFIIIHYSHHSPVHLNFFFVLSKADLHLLLLLALLQSIFVSYHRISRLTVFKFFGLALLACYTSFLYLPPLDFLSGSPSFVHDEILAKRIDCRLANN